MWFPHVVPWGLLVFLMVTHLHNLLSWPNLYIISLLNMNGFIVANLYFSLWVNGLDIYLVYKNSLTSSNQIGYIWNIARCIHNFIRYSHGFCGIWQFKNISMNLSKYSLKVWLIGKLVVLIYSKRKNYTCKWSPICYKGVNELKQAKIDVKMSIFLQLLLHLFM
jgi:hypothetical protein